ncbi:MAG: radical SAM protein, partial [Spirochaetia bacterium]
MENIFGPVPSRRLGRSIGINNIPPKVCTYSCVYCQLGRAIEMTAERRSFYTPAELVESAGRRIEELREKGEKIDYLTIVPDGEPTLDIHVGELIDGLRQFKIPVALISNGSLMADPQLREELMALDWLSVKVDAPDEETWRRIDRPHKKIDFRHMRAGIKFLAETFKGILTTETMLVKGVNDSRRQIDGIADFIETLEPVKAYISIPTRPPAESWVVPADEESIAYAYGTFASAIPFVENLIGYEGNEFNASGDARQDLLGITAVHPMRRDAVDELLK